MREGGGRGGGREVGGGRERREVESILLLMYDSLLYGSVLSVDLACNTYTHSRVYIACNLDSDAFKKLTEATKEVMGECKPYSITGSLPLVEDLQQAGFDVQVGQYKKLLAYCRTP